ncbi:MurR/RpiR family transcriptional regulator [Antarcticimicrobium luteum]|uniref:MurR/RpiR family transcriptional regulator n=1 Tax=Antarcticimicrobium luteum TaxID=2547397 RepID=A0A4V3AQ78_9RHOB|nr:MurR/RpiR family transcriptional regulator [Antarcticimicrobium luteum]TDK41377.1 MurR/RpiR family transcriptional regulator [Antarcticimicrobium luteum]
MTEPIADTLRKAFPDLTRSEKAVATYLLAHMQQLPFETAASIADSVGVSQMTVSRFLRTLGYKGLSDLKERLRADLAATPLLVSDRLDRIRTDPAADARLARNLERELQATVAVYELRHSPTWHRVARQLCSAEAVFVAGFQTISGIASDFAGRLDYIRPNAVFLQDKSGTFSELFASGGDGKLLILFEMRRYTRLSFQLARAASEAGIALAIICDTHCYWAHDFTEDVLAVNTEAELFWDSQAPFATLNNLLLDDVIAQLGDQVAKRIQHMRRLQDQFEAFVD